ncbi:MAG: hypothetical protein MZU95_12825 [Desulfomicrobium escambiense]|nr:hypothetical protein [Desulfomicrobium escambiense]
MKAIERIGLLKMDFLGLSTLTLIDDALEHDRGAPRRRASTSTTLPLDDAKTYELFCRRPDRRRLPVRVARACATSCAALKPDAASRTSSRSNALYRPGRSRRHDRRLHQAQARPQTRSTTSSRSSSRSWRTPTASWSTRSRSCSIASELAGFTLGEADLLRKAMGKKNAEVMARAAREVRRRARASSGISREEGRRSIFDLMEQFAGYGFNKSHSAAYALLAYQTGVPQGQLPASTSWRRC